VVVVRCQEYSTICLLEDKVEVPTFVPIDATEDAKPYLGILSGQQVDRPS